MKILLKDSIRSLGRAGEVVTVKDGYARNFLLPKGHAIPANQATENLVSSYTARRAQEEARMIEGAREAAGQITGLEIVLHRKANASNHLYGSVAAGDVVTQLNNRNIAIEKTMVQLEEPIKELGTFDVTIRLAEAIEAVLKIDVRDEHGEIPVLEGSLDFEDDAEDGDADDETEASTDADAEGDTTPAPEAGEGA